MEHAYFFSNSLLQIYFLISTWSEYFIVYKSKTPGGEKSKMKENYEFSYKAILISLILHKRRKSSPSHRPSGLSVKCILYALYLSIIRARYYGITVLVVNAHSSCLNISWASIFFDCANNVNSCNRSKSNRSDCVMRGLLQLLESVHWAATEWEEPGVNEVSN